MIRKALSDLDILVHDMHLFMDFPGDRESINTVINPPTGE